jgi:GMP synthase-like glutamine amidotransferase
MHRDQVTTMPEGAELLGSTDKCKLQGLLYPGRYITVQGHPEFTSEIVSEIASFRHDAGLFDDALYQDAMDRVGLDHDGVEIARAFVKFILAGQEEK